MVTANGEFALSFSFFFFFFDNETRRNNGGLMRDKSVAKTVVQFSLTTTYNPANIFFFSPLHFPPFFM